MGSAVLRADHVHRDAPPWVLEDGLSEQLLDRRILEGVRAEIAGWAPDVRAAFRLGHAVRSRLAEDVAVSGLTGNRCHYALLGAGLDTFAWRHPAAKQFRICEFDHPSTQRWKRRALREHGLSEPRRRRTSGRNAPADGTGGRDHDGRGGHRRGSTRARLISFINAAVLQQECGRCPHPPEAPRCEARSVSHACEPRGAA
jgi:hypothetical protein